MDALFRWILAGVALLGSPFVVIGGLEASRVRAELQQSEHLVGRVVGNRLVEAQRDGNTEQAYQPEVSFHSRDGAAHRFTDGAASLPPDYAIGDPVEVLFDAADPSRARIASWKRLWLVPTLFIFVGSLPGLVAWLVLSRISRATTPAPKRA